LNNENLKYFPREINENIEKVLSLGIDYEENEPHKKVTSIIMKNMKQQIAMEEDILRAAWLRGFLG